LKEISAGGVVYRKDNGSISLLALTDRFGRYSLPKGKQEAGETLKETALREIWEETAIKGTSNSRWGSSRIRTITRNTARWTKKCTIFSCGR